MSLLLLNEGDKIFDSSIPFFLKYPTSRLNYLKDSILSFNKNYSNKKNLDSIVSIIYKYYDSSMNYLRKSYEIDVKKNDIYSQYYYYVYYSTLVFNYTSINWINKDFIEFKKNNKKAIENANKAISLSEKYGIFATKKNYLSDLQSVYFDPLPYEIKYHKKTRILL